MTICTHYEILTPTTKSRVPDPTLLTERGCRGGERL
jgi:hypothetical protein